MINTWSTLSLSKFSERLNILSEKPPSIINHDNLINIYYVYSPGEVLPTHVTSVYQKLLRRVHEIIMPNTALLYPLPRKQFSAESWITSGKLLMVLESSLCGDRTTHSADFQKDFTIVTEYLTNGGRVLLVLNTVGVQNVSHTSLAHYTSLSNNSTNLRENSNSHWKWILKDSVLTGGYLYLNNENDVRVELTKDHPSIAVLGTDCLQTEPTHLKNALNLLGISCVDSEYNTCNKQLSSNLSSIHLSYSETLYCFTLNSEKKKIVDFIVNGCSTKECNEEVIYCPTVSDLPFGFNWTDYFLNLHSKHLGKLIVWANSMKSSWDFCKKLFERIPPNSGLLVCSNVQTEGKGRGDNKWITPVGQAAFTFHLTQSTSNDQMFMNCVSCTQHIVALSIILACRHLIAEHLKLLPDDTKFSDISEEFLVDLQYHGPKILIKWPNDIYVIDDNYSCDSDQDVNSKLLQHKIIGKLGGLLVHCRLVDLNHAELIIGCGINAFNEIPTISFRQILMKSHQDYMEPNFSIAKLIALVVSYVERILMKLHGSNSNYNLEWVLSLYTKCWIHTNQKVKIYPNLSMSNESDIETVQQSTNDTNTYQIVGLDNYGYLLVKDLCTGIKHQLHPDGNSMDMMRGLIMAK